METKTKIYVNCHQNCKNIYIKSNGITKIDLFIQVIMELCPKYMTEKFTYHSKLPFLLKKKKRCI